MDAVLKRVFAGSLFEYTYEGSSVVVRKRVTVAPKTDGVVIRVSCRIKTVTPSGCICCVERGHVRYGFGC